MIHLTVFIPLAIGGAITAVWRDYKKKKVPKTQQQKQKLLNVPERTLRD